MKEQKTKLLILNYLKQNPKACDTIEGITNWWVSGVDKKIVEKTVQHMVAEKILATRQVYGNTIFGFSNNL